MDEFKNFVVTKAGTLNKYNGNEANVIIPEGIVGIAARAFYNIDGGPVSITLPESLRKIDFNAFMDCRNLASINIPEGVTHIGTSAFSGCVNLKSITIPKSIKKIEDAFSYCISLSNIIVPDETVIREKCWNAFSPESKIKYCLTNVKRGISLTASESNYLKRNFEKAVQVSIDACDVDTLAASFAIKKKVAIDVIDQLLTQCANNQEICEYLLEYKGKTYSCSSVEKHHETQQNIELGLVPRPVSEWRKIFKFPASSTDGKITIDGYKSDDKVVLIPGQIGKYNVTAISSRAFKTTKITEVTIENGVTTIGVDTFLGCAYLKKLVLPETLVSLGWGAFSRCKSLLEVKIPGNVREFSSGVFAGCTSLQKVTISDGATLIGDGAFDSCPALQNVFIPSSVTAIGFGVFFGCPNITIHAPAGSYAETYAKENNIPFVAE